MQNVLAVLIIVVNTALLLFFAFVASRQFWPSAVRKASVAGQAPLQKPETGISPSSRRSLLWPPDFLSPKRGKLYVVSDIDPNGPTQEGEAARMAPVCNISDMTDDALVNDHASVASTAGATGDIRGLHGYSAGYYKDDMSSFSVEATQQKSAITSFGHVCIQLD